MTVEEINAIADKILAKTGPIPGVDKNFVIKCLQGISSLNDQEIEAKIKLFSQLF